MDQRVLSVSGVQVLTGVLVSLIFTQDSLEEVHGEEIRISPAGSFEEDTNVQVVHFIVSDGHIRGGEVGLFSVSNENGGILLSNRSEGLFSRLEESFSINITGSSNNEVGTNVVGLEVGLDGFFGDVVDVFSDTVGGLTEVVISVRSEVDVFEEESLLVVLGIDGIVVNSFLFSFNLLLVEDGVL